MIVCVCVFKPLIHLRVYFCPLALNAISVSAASHSLTRDLRGAEQPGYTRQDKPGEKSSHTRTCSEKFKHVAKHAGNSSAAAACVDPCHSASRLHEGVDLHLRIFHPVLRFPPERRLRKKQIKNLKIFVKPAAFVSTEKTNETASEICCVTPAAHLEKKRGLL